MKTMSAKRLTLKTNLRCRKIYPTEKSIPVADMKTIALCLTRQQAVDLATVLLAAAQNWDNINITGFRKDYSTRTNDYPVSVTSQQREKPEQTELVLA